METKHTKGEWRVDGTAVYSLHQTGWDNGQPLMTNRFYLQVYPDYNEPNHKEEAQANAKLIAAAPDLLEALDALLDSLGGEYQIADDIYDMATKAIKKAVE